MLLSKRATKYLSTLFRLQEWVAGRDIFIEYLRKQKFQLTEILIDIQVNYSGYRLVIENSTNSTFLLNFFSLNDIFSNNEIEFYQLENDTYLLEFGNHETAQLNFFITNFGELCTWSIYGEEKPNVIASSIEIFIEQYALRNELSNQYENAHYYNINDSEKLSNILVKEFIEIKECSDRYSYWCSNTQLTIEKGTWLDKAEPYLHIYGNDKNLCNEFIDRLKLEKIIRP
jgi:hypothetical protein